MIRLLVLAALSAFGVIVWKSWPSVRASVPDDFQKLPGADRVAQARAARSDTARARFAAAGIAYPPREIFLRAFKHEGELELWARGDEAQFRLVANYPVLARSGGPGPKRRQGDKQVPEGFYMIEKFNPESRFHLSLGIDYPNASDRLRSDRKKPGGEIFIHGKDVTIGCLPLGDAAIEELFIVALDARDAGQQQIPVHIFPARMKGPAWEEFRVAHPKWRAFWEELRAGYEGFERERRVPQVGVDAAGRYRIGEAR